VEIHKLLDENGDVIHACATASFPLPENHWVYEEAGEPPAYFQWIADTFVKGRIREAAKYAIRASTLSGKENDFDPDAMVQNFVIGLCGVSGPELTIEELGSEND
jgi:hypothetical protein